MTKKILMIAGILLFLNGVVMLFVSNINVGIILTMAVGLFFLVWGLFYDKVKELTRKGVLRAVKYAIVILLCLECVLVGFCASYGVMDNADFKEDAVIVLGAGIHGDVVSLPLKYRLDKAIEYTEKNPDAYIVVTGGQGFEETVSEASAMEKYLVANGVDKTKIIQEDEATSTNENMRFSKQILDTYFDKEYNVCVITNNFHIYRATMIAKTEGFENVTHYHAPLAWYNMATCYLRESLAILKMWVLG